MPEELPLIKVCGVTNVNDAIACADAGVQMIGLNFAPESARHVHRAQAVEIAGALRSANHDTRIVGVFVGEPFQAVQSLAEELMLDAIQLHGDEPPQYARALSPLFVIKAFRVGGNYAEAAAAAYPSNAILLDAWNSRFRGGTGETFDWSVAQSLRSRVQHLILAGGLTPQNVSAAIKAVRPYAIDVCSGVEDAPGRKSRDKVRALMDAVRSTATVSAS